MKNTHPHIVWDTQAIERRKRDAFGAWVTFFFIVPIILIGLIVFVPKLRVEFPLAIGLLGIVAASKEYRAYKALATLADIDTAHFLNLIRGYGINHEFGWEEISAEGEIKQWISFYRFIKNDDGDIERQDIATSSISVNGEFSIKGISKYISENFSKEGRKDIKYFIDYAK